MVNHCDNYTFHNKLPKKNRNAIIFLRNERNNRYDVIVGPGQVCDASLPSPPPGVRPPRAYFHEKYGFNMHIICEKYGFNMHIICILEGLLFHILYAY